MDPPCDSWFHVAALQNEAVTTILYFSKFRPQCLDLADPLSRP